MLKALFVLLDGHPGTYWTIALGPTLLLTVWILSVAWQRSKGTTTITSRTTALDFLVIILFLFAWRWPFLLVASEFNPDESQIIAGAITLAHDPVFWRSVDGTTSGPLNFYALLPLHWLGAPLDYFTARLVGLLLVSGALFFCYQALVAVFNRAVAWLGVLPAILFFATATHPDLIHYSSEHLPLFLIAVVIWLLASRQKNERFRLWTACFIAGALPWAKLQAAPISLLLAGWGLYQVIQESKSHRSTDRFKQALSVVLAFGAPTLLAMIVIVATGQAETALRRYVFHNILYVNASRPLPEALREMTRFAMLDGRLPLLLGTSAATLLASLIYFVVHRVRPQATLIVGGLLSLSAILAILAPQREFLHYVLFLPVPLTFFTGSVIGTWWNALQTNRARLLLAGGLIVVGGGIPLVTRAVQPLPSISGQFAYYWRYPRTRSAAVIHELTAKGDSLGIWGWACNLYIETGLRQATRDPHTPWSIVPNKQRDYHRSCYLADLRDSNPAVFVDAVGSGAFAFTSRLTQAHEIFPELKEFIRQNYTLVTDLGDARIYARNDLETFKKLSPPRLNQTLAKGRPNNGADTIPPTATPWDQLLQKYIYSRTVTMLLPPTRVEWRLDADVRELQIGFGFDPVAYEQGHSNGAELIVELVYSQNIRCVYRRLLNPAKNKNDQGPQSALITLPPFSAGTHLVIRTEAGEYGDNAWDWLYLANLQFMRSKDFVGEQFPGYYRVPNSADADNSTLLEENGKQILQLHAPGSLTYLLDGGERRLSFAYGFRSGAYSQGGYTDGAIFRAELEHPGQANRILFERFLQPTNHERDRGLQQIDVILPTTTHGDRLIVSIDPGPAGNAAWDWTYITEFTLE